jgi:hypothetical protein
LLSYVFDVLGIKDLPTSTHLPELAFHVLQGLNNVEKPPIRHSDGQSGLLLRQGRDGPGFCRMYGHGSSGVFTFNAAPSGAGGRMMVSTKFALASKTGGFLKKKLENFQDIENN